MKRQGLTFMQGVKLKSMMQSRLGFFVPLRNFSLIWRLHHYRWRAVKFVLCSALMAIEQWGFFLAYHTYCHRASDYNGYLRRPVTLTRIVELLAVELSLPVFYDLGLSRLGFGHRNLPLAGRTSNPLRHSCDRLRVGLEKILIIPDVSPLSRVVYGGDWGPVSWQVCHVNNPSLLKVRKPGKKPKFCNPSMAIYHYACKILTNTILREL